MPTTKQYVKQTNDVILKEYDSAVMRQDFTQRCSACDNCANSAPGVPPFRSRQEAPALGYPSGHMDRTTIRPASVSAVAFDLKRLWHLAVQNPTKVQLGALVLSPHRHSSSSCPLSPASFSSSLLSSKIAHPSHPARTAIVTATATATAIATFIKEHSRVPKFNLLECLNKLIMS